MTAELAALIFKQNMYSFLNLNRLYLYVDILAIPAVVLNAFGQLRPIDAWWESAIPTEASSCGTRSLVDFSATSVRTVT